MGNRQEIDLISLIESDLGQGRRQGRWTFFHCPFTGHKNGDRRPSLSVTNGDNNRPPFWKCWACDKQGGAVKWITEFRGMSYHDALRVLNLDKPDRAGWRQEPAIQPVDNPPGDDWQARARLLIERAESVLWEERGKDTLTWLRKRGLQDDTIRAARLGYLPVNFAEKPEDWGIPNGDTRKLYFLKGLLIPGIIASRVWYLKIRPSDPQNGQKYKHTRGGKQALYLADSLADDKPAVICEGELDALLLTQEIKNLACVITLAGASNDLNLGAWGIYLLRPSTFILAHDMDKAGNQAADKLAWLHHSQRLSIPALKEGDKDLTDFHGSGGSLYSLIKNALHPTEPIFINWPAETKPATIRDQYKRNPDNSIEAYYSPDQLTTCLEVMQARS